MREAAAADAAMRARGWGQRRRRRVRVRRGAPVAGDGGELLMRVMTQNGCRSFGLLIHSSSSPQVIGFFIRDNLGRTDP